MKLVVTARQASCRICACERTGRTAFQIIRLVSTARGMWCRRAVPGHRLQADELLRDRFRKYSEGSSPLATPPLSGSMLGSARSQDASFTAEDSRTLTPGRPTGRMIQPQSRIVASLVGTVGVLMATAIVVAQQQLNWAADDASRVATLAKDG